MFRVASIAAVAAFMLAPVSASAVTVEYTGSGFPLVDRVDDSETLSVTDYLLLSKVEVVLELQHTYSGDLLIELSHGATTVLLAGEVGSSQGSAYDGIYTITDDGTETIMGHVFGSSPTDPVASGAYAPEQALSAFIGASSLGDWTLRVVDQWVMDSGDLSGWTLRLSGDAIAPRGLPGEPSVSPVPLPSSAPFLAFGVGLLGVMRLRRGSAG